MASELPGIFLPNTLGLPHSPYSCCLGSEYFKIGSLAQPPFLFLGKCVSAKDTTVIPPPPDSVWTAVPTILESRTAARVGPSPLLMSALFPLWS